MGSESKKWSDETAWSSYIEHLTFSSDKKWRKCIVTVTGKKSSQNVDVNVAIGGKTHSFSCSPGKNKTVVKEFDAGGEYCSINVTGKLYLRGFPPAGASVLVECIYDDAPVLKSKSASWQDETGGISCIEKLFLDADKKWERCEIKVQGLKQKITGCRTTLIADGELKMNPKWCVLNGTDSKVYTVDNINAKVTLLVAGYITNNQVVAGGGAKITLTGFYY